MVELGEATCIRTTQLPTVSPSLAPSIQVFLRLFHKTLEKNWAQELGMNADFELPDAVSVVATKDGDINPEGAVVEVSERYRDKSIQTLLFAEDLEATLRNLQKKSELAVHEMGTNILYLAFGFWVLGFAMVYIFTRNHSNV